MRKWAKVIDIKNVEGWKGGKRNAKTATNKRGKIRVIFPLIVKYKFRSNIGLKSMVHAAQFRKVVTFFFDNNLDICLQPLKISNLEFKCYNS